MSHLARVKVLSLSNANVERQRFLRWGRLCPVHTLGAMLILLAPVDVWSGALTGG